MFKSVKRLLTAVTVVLVVSASSVAYARIPHELIAGSPPSAQVQLSASRAAAPSSPDFQWGYAAGALALFGLGSGAVLAIRRRLRHPLAS